MASSTSTSRRRTGRPPRLGALEGGVPEEVLRDFQQVVANLQIAYAEAAGT